jgi:AraC family transcriptional regulator
MHANLDHAISLKKVAEAAHISPSHLLRIFKRATGSPLHQFLIRLRVNRARELLLTGNASIADVAAEVGFADQSHLTRHFKRLLGTTPKKILHDLK